MTKEPRLKTEIWETASRLSVIATTGLAGLALSATLAPNAYAEPKGDPTPPSAGNTSAGTGMTITITDRALEAPINGNLDDLAELNATRKYQVDVTHDDHTITTSIK